MKIAITVIFLLIFLLIASCTTIKNKISSDNFPNIIGKWNVQKITVTKHEKIIINYEPVDNIYMFNSDGKGYKITSLTQNDIVWNLDENGLKLTFLNGFVETYKHFEVNGNQLKLEGIFDFYNNGILYPVILYLIKS